ncbi:sulfite exporter TauE/SafE family protein [Halomonas sp. MCCC 1A17488]|uniref:sulfite exporter TauE/SafE family protein n=1 Tax=unclassified Halomonas TaxID=2609666 RepID=UPI0018D23FD5|nr:MULTISPECIES: sulfite exporter TauE/SafE family protein [unclassified Halomonas]MCE8018338.1 sulfite exporter TauE/SafE family protein [Halomonas sp. MCCC 1A17488]MCG3241671.1 sulfite exporter TauE/SafE family protein [Halomonas sp. MCCC 1A17488]QPP49298.1 sulfite exporter TauE/SafE family protein [Halomonas sp. SS10-MC5]
MNEIVVFAVIATATGIAAFVQGAIGIGFALIVAPVLGFLRPDLLPVALLILMLPLNLYVGLREREAIDWKGVGWIGLGRLPGTFLGLWILVVLSADSLNQVVGASTVIAVLAALFAPVFRPKAGACASVGVITGITETATGVGGPPLALLYQHRPGPELRSTIACCFLIGEIVSLVILAVAGKFHLDQLRWALYLLPPLLIGSVASRVTHHCIDARRLRQGVLLFALVSGVVLMVPY